MIHNTFFLPDKSCPISHISAYIIIFILGDGIRAIAPFLYIIGIFYTTKYLSLNNFNGIRICCVFHFYF